MVGWRMADGKWRMADWVGQHIVLDSDLPKAVASSFSSFVYFYFYVYVYEYVYLFLLAKPTRIALQPSPSRQHVLSHVHHILILYPRFIMV
jgi:hypothetical protein